MWFKLNSEVGVRKWEVGMRKSEGGKIEHSAERIAGRQVSSISAAAARGAASQIEKETLKKRMSNIEVMYSSCRELFCRTVYFIKKD